MKKNIKIKPWLGSEYPKSNGVFRHKTLILGGSHYVEDLDTEADHSDFTNEIINIYLDQNSNGRWKATFSTFINSVFGKSASSCERKSFFDSVVFYNYLQEIAGKNPTSAHQYDYHEEKHFNAFTQLLDEQQPEVVISWGSKVWDALPNDWGYGEAKKGKGLQINGTEFIRYYDYPYKNGRILLIGVHHPSSGYGRDHHHHIFKDLKLIS